MSEKIMPSHLSQRSIDGRTDTALIDSAKRGDEVAFAALAKRYLTPIYRFIVRLVGDTEVADDVTQETFVKVWRNLAKIQSGRPFAPWLYTIARNTALDELKKKRILSFSDLTPVDSQESLVENIVATSPRPDELAIKSEEVSFLTQALGRISPKAKSVVAMHAIEGYTFREIAEMSDEPLDTVKSRYRRALLTLKRLFS